MSKKRRRKHRELHEANCWDCKWAVEGEPDKDGIIPLTCSNKCAVIEEITESVTLCSGYEESGVVFLSLFDSFKSE